jgi:hypothetical protein
VSESKEDLERMTMMDTLVEEFNESLEGLDPKVSKSLTLLSTILGEMISDVRRSLS